MLAIRLQRTGRKGHAMFRMVVQESRLTPTSGKIVFGLGSYDPHAKITIIDKAKAELYLSNGAQPSPRVISLFEKEGIKLPDWVKKSTVKQSALRHPEKLRRNQPKAEPVVEPEVATEVPAPEVPAPEVVAEAPEEVTADTTETTDETA